VTYYLDWICHEKNLLWLMGDSNMDLEDELTSALRDTDNAARARGYIATYFIQMLEEHGGRETAKSLLAVSEPQIGLYKLWELHLLDISMEAVVLRERFRSLFTEAEINEARRRLDELGYFKS
jgi:hypothetical protein